MVGERGICTSLRLETQSNVDCTITAELPEAWAAVIPAYPVPHRDAHRYSTEGLGWGVAAAGDFSDSLPSWLTHVGKTQFHYTGPV